MTEPSCGHCRSRSANGLLWFSQSELEWVTFKFTKSWRKGQKLFLRMVGENEPWIQENQILHVLRPWKL